MSEFSIEGAGVKPKRKKKEVGRKPLADKLKPLLGKREPKKEEEKKAAELKTEEVARRLLIHNTLVRSCMASFYSTQMSMWRGMMAHYEQKKP